MTGRDAVVGSARRRVEGGGAAGADGVAGADGPVEKGVDHLRVLLRRFLEEASCGEEAPLSLWLHIEPRFEELTAVEQDAVLRATTRWRLHRRKGNGPDRAGERGIPAPGGGAV